ncbi:alpha/beta fold hydrolase [Rosistilla oblonga]|uniref:alpha/beta fold hydrolase n=1 Tax=Rosistilla oblonga TaxID=2527990 RepID=UPI003A97B5CC
MPFADLPPLKVHYQQSGEGADIVLLHGFTSNLSIWMFGGVMEGLADEYRVSAVDMRGHGATNVTPADYTSDVIAEDLLRWMDHVQIESAALLGHSFGGVVATHLASLHPDRVRAIILSDAYFPGLQSLEPNMGQASVWTSLRETLLQVDTDIGPVVDFPHLFSIVGSWDDRQRKHLREQLGPIGERWLSSLVRLSGTSAGTDTFATAGLDADRIAATSVPVLALYDEHSPFEATSKFLNERLADCRQAVIPEANHLAPLENPKAIVAETKTFLSELARR